jgi:hypothetical protein
MVAMSETSDVTDLVFTTWHLGEEDINRLLYLSHMAKAHGVTVLTREFTLYANGKASEVPGAEVRFSPDGNVHLDVQVRMPTLWPLHFVARSPLDVNTLAACYMLEGSLVLGPERQAVMLGSEYGNLFVTDRSDLRAIRDFIDEYPELHSRERTLEENLRLYTLEIGDDLQLRTYQLTD